MPYAEEEVEQVEEVHFDFDTLYPSQFPRSSSRRKNVRYSPKLEAVVFKYVKEWSDQAAKSLGGIKEILPKRTAFYRAVHTSLEGLPGLSRLENDLARNPNIKASTSVALFLVRIGPDSFLFSQYQRIFIFPCLRCNGSPTAGKREGFCARKL